MSRLYPDDVASYNNSGRILQSLGRYEDAARMYRRAMEVDPRSPYPLYNLWYVLNIKLLQPVEAEEVARKLLTLQPDSPWARHALACSEFSERRFEEAERGMRAVLEVDPLNSMALPNLAHLLYRRGAYEEAVSIYRDIYQRSHDGDEAGSGTFDSLCLGLALAGAGRPDEAREVWERELEANQARLDGGAATGRQVCLLAVLGRGDEAHRMAEELDREDLADPDVLFILAEAYSLLGDREAAVGALQRAFDAGYDDRYFVLIDPPLKGLDELPAVARLLPCR
jgi:tetratricopeptide (TPR) repeat protein